MNLANQDFDQIHPLESAAGFSGEAVQHRDGPVDYSNVPSRSRSSVFQSISASFLSMQEESRGPSDGSTVQRDTSKTSDMSRNDDNLGHTSPSDLEAEQLEVSMLDGPSSGQAG